jgi:hypothetical protein
LHKLLAVELPNGGVLVDEAVHRGLRERGFVVLVVPVPPIAHEIDDDVLGELRSELERESHHAHGRFGVVSVHVEDGRLDHLRDVGRVHPGAAQFGCGGEAELVVDHDVDGAAHLVARDLGQVEGLGDDALSRECGVTVDEQRQYGPARGVADRVTLRSRHAFDHGVDGLDVARVGGERERHVATVESDMLAARAEVVLDVTGALDAARVELALELAEDLLVRLPEDVGEHVQPSPVRHTEHDLAHVRTRGLVGERVEHRNERLRALEREALLTEVLRVHEALEDFSRAQLFEDSALLLLGERRPRRLDALLDPSLLVGLLDVHVLDADRACVRVTKDAKDRAQ